MKKIYIEIKFFYVIDDVTSFFLASYASAVKRHYFQFSHYLQWLGGMTGYKDEGIVNGVELGYS